MVSLTSTSLLNPVAEINVMVLEPYMREWIVIISSILTIYSYVPYFWGIYCKQVKPHLFTWFIWGLLTGIAFFIQLDEGGGIGSWVTVVMAICCFVITFLAFHIGEKNITRSDWIAFIVSLSIIPLWLFAQDALYSMILLVVIDTVAFWPTIRKSWHKPYEESIQSYAIVAIKSVISLFAFAHINMTIVLLPVVIAITNAAFIAMLVVRRRSKQAFHP